MNNVRAALTRKIGPLPVWAWAGLLFVGIWYYRNKFSAASGTGTGSVTPTPPPPQPDTVLQPGESVYDPNTGTLTSAPGGDTTGGNGNPPDYSGLQQAITDAINAATPHLNPANTGTATDRKRHRRLNRRGGWRTLKGKKRHHKPPGKTTRHKNSNEKMRHRGEATARKPNGGRRQTMKSTGRPVKAHHRGGVKPSASIDRTNTWARVRHGVIGGGVVRQRPVANATPNRDRVTSPPRPSAPSRRTARSPARPPQRQHQKPIRRKGR